MRLPQSLIKYGSSGSPLGTQADDAALIKMGTLKRALAQIIRLIPISGPGISVRRSPDGDVWYQGIPPSPFQVSSSGKVHPALVGGIMPTLGGQPLNDTTNVLDLSSAGLVYFQFNFSVTWESSYLSAWTLDSVSVEQGTTLPTESADTKYLVFNTIADNAPAGASYFNSSINVRLLDNGVSATRLEYNPF